ncbi:F0F1 ATP synthase subunit B family protein [Streptomyces sp. SYSU K21746]
MELLPLDIGPLNPTVPELLVGLVLFAASFVVLAKVLLPRIARVLAEREDAIDGVSARAADLRAQAAQVRADRLAEIAAGRHAAAAIRHRAQDEGMALIAEAREQALRERDAIVAAGRAAIAAERAVAEAELHAYVGVWGADLATRILGEPLPASPAAEDRPADA